MFLTDEQNEEVANLFKGDIVEEDNGTDLSTQPKETDVQVEASSTSEQQNEESGHAVPYSRFKSVIEARNELRSKTSALEKQLAELQDQLNRRENSSPAKEERYFAEDSYEDFSEDPYEDKLQTYENRIYQMEVAHEQQKLNQEIQFAQQRFPDVGRELLLQAVINDPNVDVMDVAERYSTFVVGLREQAVADYLKQNPQASAPPVVRPDAPPVIKAAGSSQYGKLPGSSSEQRPKNMDEARNSLFDYLKANWSN